MAFGAKGDGTTDDTTAISNTFAAASAAGAMVQFTPGHTFLMSNVVNVANDQVIVAYGATIKWGGSGSIAGCFSNTAGINLRWYGGTVDGNNTATSISLFAFGEGSTYLASCDARDIEFINVNGAAWTCNAISATGTNYNTNVVWRNISAVKYSGGGVGDMFEIVGMNVDVEVWGDMNSTGAWQITSAWLKKARVKSTVLDAGVRKNILLQPFTSNGSAPFFDNVTIEGNGQLAFQNGNLTTTTAVSTTIRVIADQAENIQIGTSAYEHYSDVILTGTLRPQQGGTLSVGYVENIDIPWLVIDGADATGTAIPGAITSNQPSATAANLRIGHLIVRNCLVAQFTDVLGVSPSADWNSVIIQGGDISDNVTCPMWSHAFETYVTSGSFFIQNVFGYNNKLGALTLNSITSGTGVSLSGYNFVPMPFPIDFYFSAGTSNASIAVSNGVTVTAVAGQTTLVSCPAGETVTPTFSGTLTAVAQGK